MASGQPCSPSSTEDAQQGVDDGGDGTSVIQFSPAIHLGPRRERKPSIWSRAGAGQQRYHCVVCLPQRLLREGFSSRVRTRPFGEIKQERVRDCSRFPRWWRMIQGGRQACCKIFREKRMYIIEQGQQFRLEGDIQLGIPAHAHRGGFVEASVGKSLNRSRHDAITRLRVEVSFRPRIAFVNDHSANLHLLPPCLALLDIPSLGYIARLQLHADLSPVGSIEPDECSAHHRPQVALLA